MKLLELIEMLKDKPLDMDVVFRVDCPHGGNSLPCEVDVVLDADYGTCIVFSPEDGVEFEVFDREDEEDEDEDDDEGPTVVIFKTLAEAQAKYPNAEFHGEGEDVINES